MANSSRIIKKHESDDLEVDNKELPGSPKSLYSRISLLLKLGITLLLLALVYASIDHRSLFIRLSSLEFSSIVIIATLYFLGQLVSSLKWRIFLSEAGIPIHQLVVTRAFFLGMFVNTFGLGTVGGDMTRALSIPCPKGYRSAAIASVLADRIHGLMMLLFLGTSAILIVKPSYVSRDFLLVLEIALVLLFLGWLVGPRLLLNILPSRLPFKEKIETALGAFPHKFSSLLLASVISLVFHSIQVTMAFQIFKALGAPITFSVAFTTIPFINAASAMPFSINGLGVREAVGIYLLQPAGVSPESSAAFAAIWIIVVTVISAVGGLFVVNSTGEKLISVFHKNKSPRKI